MNQNTRNSEIRLSRKTSIEYLCALSKKLNSTEFGRENNQMVIAVLKISIYFE